MQFKHPEVLFFLFLLIIPLLIHLFQLQKFRKEAFTNVKFLKEIELETRKSSKLKKLLILLTRMLVFTALIMAFSQPFINRNKGLQKNKNIYYIDNSLSLQAKGSSGIDQFQFIKNTLMDNDDATSEPIDLVSNDRFLKNLDGRELVKELIALPFSPSKNDINQILLQLNNEYKNSPGTMFQIYLMSDFQKINGQIDTALINPSFEYSLVDLSVEQVENISLDTLWIDEIREGQVVLKAALSSHEMTVNDLSVSLTMNDELFGKTTVSLTPGSVQDIEFLIPETVEITGYLSITDHRLSFDNQLYFSLPEIPKKKVLIIGELNSFLDRIYLKDEFVLTKNDPQNLDQSLFPEQDLIILNELDRLSGPLIQNLRNYVQNSGNLVVIPSMNSDIQSYNNLLLSFNDGRILEKFNRNKIVNKINYKHPFYKGVFEKEVYNFQYPIITEGFEVAFDRASALLEFEDMTDFITEIKFYDNKVYWISAPLSVQENSFVNSPLIVPVFYNFAARHDLEKSIYLNIGESNEITLPGNYSGDAPVKIIQGDKEFIPAQVKSSNQIRVTTEDFPSISGIYDLVLEGQLLRRMAFNYNRTESKLDFLDVVPLSQTYSNIRRFDSLKKAIKEDSKRNNNKDLWQLFIIFALVFLVLEILLQKFLKN